MFFSFERLIADTLGIEGMRFAALHVELCCCYYCSWQDAKWEHGKHSSCKLELHAYRDLQRILQQFSLAMRYRCLSE